MGSMFCDNQRGHGRDSERQVHYEPDALKLSHSSASASTGLRHCRHEPWGNNQSSKPAQSEGVRRAEERGRRSVGVPGGANSN